MGMDLFLSFCLPSADVLSSKQQKASLLPERLLLTLRTMDPQSILATFTVG
jgi:hypothetical protein